MTCAHGFIGACAECDGAGQMPEPDERYVEFGTPVLCLRHAERACLCDVTPCPCDCHQIHANGADRAHPIGCICGECSTALIADEWDPRMGPR